MRRRSLDKSFVQFSPNLRNYSLTILLQIDSFLAEKDEIFEAVFDLAAEFEEADEMPSEAQREEVDKLRARFVSRTKETYESLMGSELVLVTQTEQVRVLHCIIYHTDFFTEELF